MNCTALMAVRIKMMTARMAEPPIVTPAIATEIKVLAAMLAAAAKTEGNCGSRCSATVIQ